MTWSKLVAAGSRRDYPDAMAGQPPALIVISAGSADDLTLIIRPRRRHEMTGSVGSPLFRPRSRDPKRELQCGHAFPASMRNSRFCYGHAHDRRGLAMSLHTAMCCCGVHAATSGEAGIVRSRQIDRTSMLIDALGMQGGGRRPGHRGSRTARVILSGIT